MSTLHEELTGDITEINEWGYLVKLPSGDEGFVDKTKTLAWAGQGPERRVGDTVLVVVLDDGRIPCRLSELRNDIEIAKQLREEASFG